MIRSVFLALIGLSCLSSSAFAQTTDPVDKNKGGAYAGGQVLFGQAKKVGKSSPGPAYLLSADVGYGLRRDTWNRVEFGLELGTGAASFKDEDNDIDVDLDIDMMIMLKGGYGYSLGDHAFGIFRAGLGIAQVSYDGKADNGFKIDGGKSSGIAAMLGWDAVMPVSDSADLLFGVNFRIINLEFDDAAGQSQPFQLNIPALYAGARTRF